MRRPSPVLKIGQHVRRADGSLWEVTRVGACSATIRCTVASAREIGSREIVYNAGSASERRRTVPVWSDGSRPGDRLEISPCSPSYRAPLARQADAPPTLGRIAK